MCTHLHTHACTCEGAVTQSGTCIHFCTYTHTRTRAHTHTCSGACTQSRTCVQACAHVYMHIHTHKYVCICTQCTQSLAGDLEAVVMGHHVAVPLADLRWKSQGSEASFLNFRVDGFQAKQRIVCGCEPVRRSGVALWAWAAAVHCITTSRSVHMFMFIACCGVALSCVSSTASLEL